jgi:hypothetical protein
VAGNIFTAIETNEIWIEPDHVGRVGIALLLDPNLSEM